MVREPAGAIQPQGISYHEGALGGNRGCLGNDGVTRLQLPANSGEAVGDPLEVRGLL
jgi:hypothetical protein